MKKKHGFTLIEIAIVVVIIGLLVAGVMVAQSLIRNSNLRAITAESGVYTQALGIFRDKYQALPGDFAGASGVWSGVTNGDGNGLITVNLPAIRLDEQFLAWQHLAKSEIIKGSFTGVAGSGGARERIPGENIPLSTLPNTGWGLISVTLTDLVGGYDEIPYTAPDMPPNHVLWYGGRSINANGDRMTPLITISEALAIDIKSDDGSRETGKIVSQANDAENICFPSETAKTILKDSGNCSLVFKTGY